MYMRLGFTHCDFTFKYYLTHLIHLSDAYELVNMINITKLSTLNHVSCNHLPKMTFCATRWVLFLLHGRNHFFNYFSYCLLLPLSASGDAIYWWLHGRKWRRRHLGCHAKMQSKMTLSSDLSPIRCSPLPEAFITYSWIITPRDILKQSDKKFKQCHTREHNQRVLMHGHQGWNAPHGLCHIDIMSICTKHILVHLPESEFQTSVSLYSCLNFARPS